MSEPSLSSSPQTDAPAPAGRRRTPVWLLALLVLLPAAAIGGVLYLLSTQSERDSIASNHQLMLQATGLANPVQNEIDTTRYVDADRDMVPDGPAGRPPAADPDVLRFSYVATEEPEKYQAVFAEFVAHLSKVTGKTAEYAPYTDTVDELRALRDGSLHVVGLNTGSVPRAVNACGFVPKFALATADGTHTYQMEIIVPADSPIRAPADLKAHELTLTDPASNSGAKAPRVLLRSAFGLEEVRDFTTRYSGGQNESIRGIASHQYQAAAVANDLLAREVSAGTISRDAYRSIFKSDNFPTASFGYSCTLKPELAAKVAEAFRTFDWKGSGVEKEFGASGQTRLVPLSYHDDFAIVRQIDDLTGTVHALPEPPAPAAPTTATTTAPAVPSAEPLPAAQ